MINSALYAVTVLVFGSSWYVVRWQIGVVPEVQSVAYRFALAAAIIFIWIWARGERAGLPRPSHPWLAVLGATMFSLNFFQVYLATNYTTTGLIAVAFSTTSVFVAILSALFLRQPTSVRVWSALPLGVVGIALIFWPEIRGFHPGDDGLTGLALAMSATMTFSVGTAISVRNRAAGMPLLPMTGWGMAYGAALLFAISAFSGHAPTFDSGVAYVASFAYLTIFTTVIAFASYLTLIQRIGAARAAYATVLWPVVALTLSTLFEGYEWTSAAAAGVVLVLIGNILVLLPARPPAVVLQPGR